MERDVDKFISLLTRKGNIDIKMKIGFKLNREQLSNRNLLSKTMIQAGFLPLSHEWWHFNGIPKGEARNKYEIIE